MNAVLVKMSVFFPGNTPYNGQYGEVPPERGTFFRLQVYKRVGFYLLKYIKRVGKSVILPDLSKGPKGLTDRPFLTVKIVESTFCRFFDLFRI